LPRLDEGDEIHDPAGVTGPHGEQEQHEGDAREVGHDHRALAIPAIHEDACDRADDETGEGRRDEHRSCRQD